MASPVPVDLGHINTSHAQYGLLAPMESKVNDALQRSDNLALEQAAADLTDPKQWAEKDLELDDYTYLLFGICLAKVQAIPHAHPYQQRLMHLLRAIQPRPSPLEDEEPDFWINLPGFWLQIAEVFNEQGLFESITGGSDGERRMTVSQWTNLHSFLAEWYASEPDADQATFGYFYKAIQLFSHVLERPRKKQTLVENLPAIAVWLTSSAGPKLRANCKQSQALNARDSTRLLRNPEPEYYSGPDEWNEQRWDFWSGKLKELMEDEKQLGSEACRTARKAYEAMEDLKKGGA